jgi:hypothetical protein
MKTGNGLDLVMSVALLQDHITLVYNYDGFSYVRGKGPDGDSAYEWSGQYSTVVEAKHAAIAAGIPITAVFYPAK